MRKITSARCLQGGAALVSVWLALSPAPANAGAQIYETMGASVRASLQKAVSDRATTQTAFDSNQEGLAWLETMSTRLQKRFPDRDERFDFLKTVHYEARRAGLDPHLVLGLIQVESAFRKYAVSTAGAVGFMQVMPFWVREIGTKDQNLFHLRLNLRYGCTILRHYLDIERGNLFRALGRYNGSLGRPEYPNLVLSAWKSGWEFQPKAIAPERVAGAAGKPNL